MKLIFYNIKLTILCIESTLYYMTNYRVNHLLYKVNHLMHRINPLLYGVHHQYKRALSEQNIQLFEEVCNTDFLKIVF